jgi:hypothetical protein
VIGEQDAPTETIGPARKRERRKLKLAAALTVVVLAVLGFASYKFVSGVGHTGKTTASHPPAAARSTPATQPSSPAASPATASASPSSASSSGQAQPQAQAQTLKPVSVAAFGPAGTADGDGIAQAGYAIDGNPATDWRTDWYTTSLFGGLQTGTGLLADLGKTATITSVQVTLGGARGANLQIRAGNTAALTSLPPVATATDAAGAVNLKLANPVHARFVLLWFTALPPDNAGTYQAQVYDITVSGQP